MLIKNQMTDFKKFNECKVYLRLKKRLLQYNTRMRSLVWRLLTICTTCIFPKSVVILTKS